MSHSSSPRPQVTRRRFLTIGGVSVMWMATGCRSGDDLSTSQIQISTSTIPATTTSQLVAAEAGPGDDRVLVVVQLLGGNDGLNTLIPVDGHYRDARPSLAVPESGLLTLTGSTEFALHPSLQPLAGLWDSGALGFAAGVAFDEQTRSHFTSRDVWWRGGGDTTAAGWLARWIDAAGIDQPDEPMEAIALGSGPRALAGSTASAVDNPAAFELRSPPGMSDEAFETFLLSLAAADQSDSAIMSAARGSLPAALSTQKILDDVGNDAAGDAYTVDASAPLSLQLQTAAALIRSRPQLRVVTVGIEGFDTHADQSTVHADLLGQVAMALTEFWEALGPEHQRRTLAMTTTEFGRRVEENGSEGTDHGRAGTQLLLGGAVVGGQVIGGYRLADLEDGDLPITVSGRELYADALRWLGGPVKEVIGSDPPTTGLVMF